MISKRTTAILIFPDVEVLDFAGPYEVFSRTRLISGVESRRSDESAPFQVFTVAKNSDLITAVGGLRVLPDYEFRTAPEIDVLVVPGGFGSRNLLRDTETLDWIQRVNQQASQLCSVCTGALVLAKLGLLKNKRATTHWGAMELLQQSGMIHENSPYVDSFGNSNFSSLINHSNSHLTTLKFLHICQIFLR